MRDIFGFPDEETMLHLLENDSKFPENNDKTCGICPNCYSPSMSPNHVCNVNDDNDDFSQFLNKLSAIFSQPQMFAD